MPKDESESEESSEEESEEEEKPKEKEKETAPAKDAKADSAKVVICNNSTIIMIHLASCNTYICKLICVTCIDGQLISVM